MKFLTITLVVLLSISSIKCHGDDCECIKTESWKNYKQKNELEFSSLEKEEEACHVREDSLARLASIKKQRSDFAEGFGETSAMHLNLTNYHGVKVESAEFAKRRLVYRYTPKLRINQIPRSFNWVDQGFNSPVRHQGECGSCYSFSAAGAIEGQNFICNKDTSSLSEQYLLDCSRASDGCGGADPASVSDLASTAAIPFDKDYPYTLGKCSPYEWSQHKAGRYQNDCRQNQQCSRQNRNGFKIDTVEYLEKGNEDQLLIALYENGPIMVTMSIEPNINMYNGRTVYDSTQCSATSVDHAVLLVGYTPEYYIIKNSWGANWGKNGYLHMARRSRNPLGTCAILAHSQVVKKNGCRNL